MSTLLQLAPLLDLPLDIEELRVEARADGFRFLDKLVAEWNAGKIRFAEPGELLIGAFLEAVTDCGGVSGSA